MQTTQQKAVSTLLCVIAAWCNGCMSMTRDELSRNPLGSPLSGTIAVTSAILEYDKRSFHKGALTLQVAFDAKSLPKEFRNITAPLILKNCEDISDAKYTPLVIDSHSVAALSVCLISGWPNRWLFTLNHPSLPTRSFNMFIPGSSESICTE